VKVSYEEAERRGRASWEDDKEALRLERVALDAASDVLRQEKKASEAEALASKDREA